MKDLSCCVRPLPEIVIQYYKERSTCLIRKSVTKCDICHTFVGLPLWCNLFELCNSYYRGNIFQNLNNARREESEAGQGLSLRLLPPEVQIRSGGRNVFHQTKRR